MPRAALDGPTGSFEERGGYGPLHVTVRDGTSRRGYPERDWTCRSRGSSQQGNVTTLRWGGCELDDVGGDFDVTATTTGVTGTAISLLDVSVESRLALPMTDFRFLLRINPEALPPAGGDTPRSYALFGYNEWIPDPVESLRPDARNPEHLWARHDAYLVEEARGDEVVTGFHRNRTKPQPVLSVHTEDWGLAFFTTDDANADAGNLLLGSNNGSVEFGYTFSMPRSHEPGNGGGAIQIGPTFAAHALRATAPLSTAWTETVDAYRPVIEHLGLVPGPLHEEAFPADWSRDCLYVALPGGPEINAPGLAAWVEAIVAFHTAQAPDLGTRPRFCVDVWSGNVLMPYEPITGFEEFLALLHDVGERWGADVHTMTYVHANYGDFERLQAHPELQHAIMRDPSGAPITFFERGTQRVAAYTDPGHEAVLAETERRFIELYDAGLHGTYWDAPFGEMWTGRTAAGATAYDHLALRHGMQRLADTLTELGGGAIVSEGLRVGLQSTKAPAHFTGPYVRRSSSVPFADMLLHDRRITAFFGDIVSEPFGILCADAAYDEFFLARGGERGAANNAQHAVYPTVDAVVQGRVGIEPLDLTTFCDEPPAVHATLMGQWRETVRRGYHFRRQHPVLQTGKLLAPPRTDAGTVKIYARTVPYLQVNSELSNSVITREQDAVPAALYEDLEHPGEFVIVAGNPGAAPRTVTVTVDRARYPGTAGTTFRLAGAGAALNQTADTIAVTLDLAGHDFATARLQP